MIIYIYTNGCDESLNEKPGGHYFAFEQGALMESSADHQHWRDDLWKSKGPRIRKSINNNGNDHLSISMDQRCLSRWLLCEQPGGGCNTSFKDRDLVWFSLETNSSDKIHIAKCATHVSSEHVIVDFKLRNVYDQECIPTQCASSLLTSSSFNCQNPTCFHSFPISTSGPVSFAPKSVQSCSIRLNQNKYPS